MKRNRESKYRQKIINRLHKNKSQQKFLDAIVQKYGFTYYDMYQFAVKHNFSHSKDMIYKMIEYEMDEVFKSFGEMSELPVDLFEPMNCFGVDKKSYYLGVDFARGNDWKGNIVLNNKIFEKEKN